MFRSGSTAQRMRVRRIQNWTFAADRKRAGNELPLGGCRSIDRDTQTRIGIFATPKAEKTRVHTRATAIIGTIRSAAIHRVQQSGV
jgi:hypothetical protein